jgi:hypothetical protein
VASLDYMMPYVYLNVYVADMPSMDMMRSKLTSDLAEAAEVSELRFAHGSKNYTDSKG